MGKLIARNCPTRFHRRAEPSARRFSLFLGLVFGLLFASDVLAEKARPSFDCTKPSTPVAQVICADADLSALDRQMTRVFAEHPSIHELGQRKALAEDQRSWLRFMAPSCSLPDSGEIAIDRFQAAVPCLRDVYRDRIGVLMMRCEVDENHSLDEIAAWDEPWSMKVPKDFKVEGGLMTFVVTFDAWRTSSYNLPSESLPAARRVEVSLKAPYRGMALCRAIGPDGKRWLASPLRDGNLSYVLESATAPASE